MLNYVASPNHLIFNLLVIMDKALEKSTMKKPRLTKAHAAEIASEAYKNSISFYLTPVPQDRIPREGRYLSKNDCLDDAYIFAAINPCMVGPATYIAVSKKTGMITAQFTCGE